jgi:hypothetical protein
LDNLGNIIDFSLPALALLFAIVCLLEAFKHHRRKPKPQCLKCAYDLRASDSLTCPECGFTHQNQHQRLHGRISKPYLISGLLLLALGLIPPVAFATQYARNNAALARADAIKPQLAPALISDHKTYVETSNYTSLTRWVARQADWDDSTAFLDDSLFKPRFQNWSDPRFLCVYFSSLCLSPRRHYGRYVGVIVPWRYASQPVGTTLTTTQTAHLLTLAAQSPGLKNLLLQNDFPVDDQSIPGLQTATDLYSIDILNCGFTPKGIAGLASLPNLKGLDLTYPRQVTDQDVHACLSFPQLTTLRIKSQNKASALTPACFASGQQAERFYLDLPIPLYTASDPAPFKNLPPKWTSLSLILPDITPKQLASMPLGMPYAQLTLDFTGNTQITDTDLDWLVKNPDYLRELRITPGPNISAQLVDRLCSKLSARKPLSIYNTPTTLTFDISNLAISQKSLESLAIPRCSSLILRRCTLDPSGLAGLAKVPTLTQIGMQQIPLSPADYKTLAALPSLKTITLDRIDDQTLAILAQSPLSLTVFAIKDDTTPAARSLARNIWIIQIQDFN